MFSNPSVNPKFEALLHFGQDISSEGKSRPVDTRRKASSPIRYFKRHLSPEDIETILAGYKAGITAKELGAQFEINRNTVSALLKREGVKMRNTPISPSEIEEAKVLYASGLSTDAVGTQLGRNAGTIWRGLSQAGVMLRDSHGKER